MPLLASTAAASASLAGEVFDYNRENYMYDRKMRQETEYQIMDFRIEQADLWREDVEDIIELTSVKMDTYLIVNAIQLLFTMLLFAEGRIAVGTPTWLVGCHTLSIAGAFMYLLMSVWFAVHASVTAKGYGVRLLTQLVRLPVPSWAQLESARTYGSSFEKAPTKQMFRVPFAFGTQENVLRESAASSSSASQSQGASQEPGSSMPQGATRSADLWGLEGRGDLIYELDGRVRTDGRALKHLQCVKEVRTYWQSYDAFSRVAMSMGTNQLIMGLSYYVIAWVLVSNKDVAAALFVILVFMVVACSLISLDMSLTALEYRTTCALVSAGPLFAFFGAQQWRLMTTNGFRNSHAFAPLPYATTAAWLMLLLYISKVGKVHEGKSALPTGFRSVMYIDIFGWVQRGRERAIKERRKTQRVKGSATESVAGMVEAGEAPGFDAPPEPEGGWAGWRDLEPAGRLVSGKGPAVQATNYSGRLLKGPEPTRPELMPNASKGPPQSWCTKEAFNPTSFMPQEKEGLELDKAAEVEIHPHLTAGLVPWRVFSTATALLLTLWWVSGLLILFQAGGYTGLRVAPLLGEVPEEEGGENPDEVIASTEKPALVAGGTSGVFLQTSETKRLVGERIDTHWPHLTGSAPGHLACSTDAEGKISLLASSHYGIFTSQLEMAVKGRAGQPSSNRTAAFQYVPPCEGLDGEVQDVSVTCGDAHCRAFVLHGEGRQLTTCRMHASEAFDETSLLQGTNSMDGSTSKLDLGGGWLRDASSESPEEVTSFTFAGGCAEAQGRCAYAFTSGHRLLELRQGAAEWSPTRALLPGRSANVEGEALHMLGREHLGLLTAGGTELIAVNVRSGESAGRWPLPRMKRWTSMCSTSGSLYLLGEEGRSRQPQLFRFPLPESLHPAKQTKPLPSKVEAKSQRKPVSPSKASLSTDR